MLLVNSSDLRVIRRGCLSILVAGNPCLQRCGGLLNHGGPQRRFEGKKDHVDFELTDKQRKLVEAFRAFGEETFTPEHVHQWRRDQGLPDEVAKGFVDLYFGLEELEDGEGTLCLLSQALIIEELSRCAGGDAAVPKRPVQPLHRAAVRR